MSDFLNQYIASIAQKYSFEETSEMGYRTEFEELLKKIFESTSGVNIFHDARASQGNKPDFIVSKNRIPLLYLEVKNIGESLDKIEKSDQMSRYYGYDNLILSDYLEFRFYRLGIPYGEPIKIANFDKKTRTISPFPDKYEYLAKTIFDFTDSHKESIKSANHLAKIMGGKGQRLRDNVRHLFNVQSEANRDLEKLYITIKELLVADLTPHAFADMYAQTLVYGLFVARYHDESLNNFSRQEARELIPNSNRLLKHFFDHIVGAEFKSSLKHIVDELCEVFSHSNVQELMKQYFRKNALNQGDYEKDSVIHFYEDFLKEYDPELRKKMGAYYTPLPIVRFIIRSLDEILKNSFDLSNGLADTTKDISGFHKVQILDPAVGTGTFLSEIVELIYSSFKGQEGRWPGYVHKDLLPRLHGFELMMTPYTIAHLKLGIEFRRRGFWDFHRRLGIYLTNSLDKAPQQEQMLAFGLAESIAEESKEASLIKNESPIMIVVGNPPYNVSSSNRGRWIQDLIQDYKENLHEKKTNLDDDYIKFIRYAEYFIEKNKTGIVAMITNNSFLDGITHRIMRRHLLQTFESIYIINLHGNSKKGENPPPGVKDENVFEIQQGVTISIYIRNNFDKTKLGIINYAEFYGKKEDKFSMLDSNTLSSLKWKQLDPTEPSYYFLPKNFKLENVYKSYISLKDVFISLGSGIKNERDAICVDFDRQSLEQRVTDFAEMSESDLRLKYQLSDSRDWKISNAKEDILDHHGADLYYEIMYRPYDIRWTYYTGTSRGFIGTPNTKGMVPMLKSNQLLVFTRLNRQRSIGYFFTTSQLVDIHLLDSAADSLSSAPLYTFTEDGQRISNLDQAFVSKIEKVVGKVTPEDIFAYIYAILYSPIYREKYKEFLKIDFPRIPYPENKGTFRNLVKLGLGLREFHLLESPKLSKFVTTFSIRGSDIVEKVEYKDAKVYINETQYFGDVPKVAWSFWIGGYQPAQKWLKDRKGRQLASEDIEHYQKIILALTETDKLMKQIDGILNF